MTALEVVGMNVLPDRSSGLLDVVPFCQAGFLILERAEPPLDLDVVSPAAPAFSIGYRLGFIVDAGSVDTTEICGHADRNLRLVSLRTEASD